MKILDYQVIFWDFDGVIKESIDIKTVAFLKLFQSYGEEVQEKVKYHHLMNGGISRYVKIPYYFQEFLGKTLTEDELQIKLSEYSDLVIEAVIDAPWVPGVYDYLMENYQQQDFYVVSGTPETELQYIIQRLKINHCFQGIFGAPRNKITIINTVFEQQQYQLKNCLMIGDASTDHIAATSTQIDFLWRKSRFNQEYFRKNQCPTIQDFINIGNHVF